MAKRKRNSRRQKRNLLTVILSYLYGGGANKPSRSNKKRSAKSVAGASKALKRKRKARPNKKKVQRTRRVKKVSSRTIKKKAKTNRRRPVEKVAKRHQERVQNQKEKEGVTKETVAEEGMIESLESPNKSETIQPQETKNDTGSVDIEFTDNSENKSSSNESELRDEMKEEGFLESVSKSDEKIVKTKKDSTVSEQKRGVFSFLSRADNGEKKLSKKEEIKKKKE